MFLIHISSISTFVIPEHSRIVFPYTPEFRYGDVTWISQ